MKILFSLFYTLVLSLFATAGVMELNPDVSVELAFVGSFLGIEVLSLLVPQGVVGANAWSDTVLLDAIAFLTDEKNRKFQMRHNPHTAIDAFLAGRDYSIPDLGAIRKADTQTTKAKYIKQKTFTVNEAKSCSPTGETSGSGSVSLSWVTRSVSIVANYSQYAGNMVAQAKALQEDLFNAQVSLFGNVDQYLIDYLETNKSGVNAAGSDANFDPTDDIMSIDDSNVGRFYNYVTAHMQMNNYFPTFHHVHDTLWGADQQYYANQGSSNNINTLFQFPGWQFHPSNLITPGTIGSTVYTSVGYVIPEGGVAIVDWNAPLNRANEATGDKKWMTMQSTLRPEFSLDVLRTRTCADTSADGGTVQDLQEVIELSLTFSAVKQPVPTANDTPIFKYGVTASFAS